MADATILRVFNNAQLREEEDRRIRDEAQAAQSSPVVSQLAAYLRNCWEAARRAKEPIERELLRAKRQRAGQYETDKLAEIRASGGSEIFMMITEVKCRAAESWIRDILLDAGPPPWDLKPTPIPELSPDQKVQLEQEFTSVILSLIQATGVGPEETEMPAMRQMFEDDFRMRLLQAAQDKADKMAAKIKDQFAEGGWYEAFNEFVTDLTTYKTAFIKGPIVRKQTKLGWVRGTDGRTKVDVVTRLGPEYERIDPFRIYPEPGISCLDHGYVFEHRPMPRSEVAALIGVPGYHEESIRTVLREGPRASWFFSPNELEKNELENKPQSWTRPTDMFDCLEFWGKISGSMLLEWGIDPEQVPDKEREYDACVMTIGDYVIKAVLNYDPLGQKPYAYSSMFKVPGALWGRGIPEVIEDIQNVCNAAARALVNNMGIASGPQVEVNIERLAPGEDLTQMYPWKIWQVKSDAAGGSARAVNFEQPDDRATTLMAVFDKFSRMADEHSGVPSYVSGDIAVTGAGRTSSGLSMLMGAAGKGIRQVVTYIDNDVVKKIVTRQFVYNMRFGDDESVKGDVVIVPRGAVNLATKETAEIRRIEFLQATANPIDFEIMGIEGRAAVLREVTKSLQMPNEEIVPGRKKLQLKSQVQQQLQFQQGQTQAPGGTPALPDGSPAGGAAANLSGNRGA